MKSNWRRPLRLKSRGRTPIRCSNQLKELRLLFLPPDRECFHLFANLGAGRRLFADSVYHEAEVAAECGEWYQTGLAVFRDKGQGFFWEILQQTLMLNDKLQELEAGTKLFEDFYSYSCSALLDLTDLFGRAIQRPVALSSFTSSGEGLIRSHCALHHAIQFLITAAAVLPESEVQYIVVRTVFGCEPFVDIANSDPKARAMIVAAGFQLIDIMTERSMEIKEALSLMGEWLKMLLEESRSIDKMLRRPLGIRKGINWRPDMFATNQESLVYLKMLQKSDKSIVELSMIHFERLLCVCLSEEKLDAEKVFILMEIALELFRSAAASLKRTAVDVLILGLEVMRRRADKESLIQYLDDLGTKIMSVMKDYIDSCLRNPKKAQDSDDSSPVAKENEVLDGVAQVSGKLKGLSLASERVTWQEVEHFGVEPFTVEMFLEQAPMIHRQFQAVYLASLMEVILPSHTLKPAELQFCVLIWIGQMMEQKYDQIKIYLTNSLSLDSRFSIFKDMEFEKLILNGGGVQGCAALVGKAIKRIWISETGTSIVPFVTARLHQVAAARMDEMAASRDSSGIIRLCSVIVSIVKLRVPGATLTESNLLVRTTERRDRHVVPLEQRRQLTIFFFSTTFHSVIRLEQEYFYETSSDVRQKLKESSLKYLPDMISELTRAANPSSSLLKALRFLIAMIMEVPDCPIGPNPVDLAVYELIAEALTTWNDLDKKSKLEFLIFIFRDVFWLYLDNASHSNASAERAVVNGLHFLTKIFDQPTMARKDVLSVVLPCLVSPICWIARSHDSREFSPMCKIPVYSLLHEIFSRNPHILPPVPYDINSTKIKGNVKLKDGPLEKGEEVSDELLDKALQILLCVCLRSALSDLRLVIPNHVLARAPPPTSHIHCYLPITQLDATRAQASLTVLFGQYRRPQWIDRLIRSKPDRIPEFANLDIEEVAEGAQDEYPSALFRFIPTFATISDLAAEWISPIIPPLKALMETKCSLITKYRSDFDLVEERVRAAGIDPYRPRIKAEAIDQSFIKTEPL